MRGGGDRAHGIHIERAGHFRLTLAHIRPTLGGGNHERIRRFALDKLLDCPRIPDIERDGVRHWPAEGSADDLPGRLSRQFVDDSATEQARRSYDCDLEHDPRSP